VTLSESPSVVYHPVADGRVEGAPTCERTVDGGAVDGATVGDELTAAYRERRRELGVDETLATVSEPLRRTETERFCRGSRLGNFAADAFRAAADADVAVFPAGSLRAGPPLDGAVTVADVVSLCPFGGDVVELELPGGDIRRELESMATPRPERGWVHCHLSGARAVWTDADELRSVHVGGDPLDPGANYRVATAAFAVAVPEFDRLTTDDVVARHDAQYEALVSHARDGGIEAELDGRISRVPADG
jgi:2',3'-cyclic-nucleotide 2'-phosphodiesterase (5'-nucleotidase family)